MLPILPSNETVNALIAALWEACDAIIAIYRSEDRDVTYKDDNSPLTAADQASHDILAQALRRLTPDIPLLSEEGELAPWAVRSQWRRFWLLDPMDGTKEFLKANGQFTINLGLVEGHSPSLGLVAVPTEQMIYLGVPSQRRCLSYHRATPPKTQPTSLVGRKLPQTEPAVILASHNHSTGRYKNCLDFLTANLPAGITIESAGSALKFCLMVNGEADFYPRLHPTYLWDTAAPHAVLAAAGGEVFDLQGESLRYNHQDELLNPDFIAVTDNSYPWLRTLAPLLEDLRQNRLL